MNAVSAGFWRFGADLKYEQKPTFGTKWGTPGIRVPFGREKIPMHVPPPGGRFLAGKRALRPFLREISLFSPESCNCCWVSKPTVRVRCVMTFFLKACSCPPDHFCGSYGRWFLFQNCSIRSNVDVILCRLHSIDAVQIYSMAWLYSIDAVKKKSMFGSDLLSINSRNTRCFYW